jgi:predicted nucleotidyltransferase
MSHLTSKGHQNLTTSCGPLDVLGTLGTGLTYDDLLPHTIEVEFGELRVRILGLAKIIELKEELRRDKDLAMLPTLRATLKEQQRGSY